MKVRDVSVVLLVFSVASVARAGERLAARAVEVRVPQSPTDHLELAALYQKVADEQRRKADSLRKSWTAEIQKRTPFPNKGGVEFPWIAKLKKQAQAEISQAEAAEEEAGRFAGYHRMRAKELEGLEFAHLAAALRGGR